MNPQRIPLQYDTFKKTVENITLLEKTGTLEVVNRANSRSYFFYIKKGEIIYIEEHPVRLENRIGDYLLKQGLINEEQLRQALGKQKTNKYEFLGDLLLKEGFISPKELLQSLTHQIENVLFLISLITDGFFTFAEGDTPERMPQIPYTITLSNLLMIFLKSSEIIVKMPFLKETLNLGFQVDKAAVNINKLNPMEQWIVDALRRGATVFAILDQAKNTNYITLMSVIYSLYDRNIIRDPEPQDSPGKQPPPPGPLHPGKESSFPKTFPADTPPPPKPPKEEKKRLPSEPIEFVYRSEPQPYPSKPKQQPQPSSQKNPAEKSSARPAARQPLRPAKKKKTYRPMSYALADILSFLAVLVLLILYLGMLRPLFKTPVAEHFHLMTPETLEEVKIQRTLNMGKTLTPEELLKRKDFWQNSFYSKKGETFSSGPDGIPDTPDDFRVM
jgi:hypothetical protein